MRVTFIKEKETKNTIRYNELVAENDWPRIGTIYIQKAAVVQEGFGDKIIVEVTKQ